MTTRSWHPKTPDAPGPEPIYANAAGYVSECDINGVRIACTQEHGIFYTWHRAAWGLSCVHKGATEAEAYAGWTK